MGPLAQSVEQRTFNPWVVGSIPTGPTHIKAIPGQKWRQLKKLSLKVTIFFYRLKFLLQHPLRSIIHILSRRKDYSKIKIDEIRRYMESPKFIVEAGASDGVDTLAFVQNFPGITVFAAEPVKKQFDFLTEKFRNIGSIKLSQVALSSKTELVNIYIGRTNRELGGMGSSSLLNPSLHKKYFPEISFDETQLTPAVTLESFFLSNDLNIVDLLWLDIQGMELDVMKSSKDTMQQGVKLLHLEISNVQFYEGMPDAKDIRSFLGSIGFKCVIDRVGAISGNALFVNQNLK